MSKALLIKSTAGTKQAIQGVWHQFDQATPYIQGIETGDLLENINAEVLNSMISGLPSVWSRARMFMYAFKYTQKEANIKTSGLIKFYENMIREWKGLIALIALHPVRISISEPIYFDPDNKHDLYKITNAFGRMLFEDVDLWCDPAVLKFQKLQKPFIQLIYYNNVLVGGTSPYTFLFSGIEYDDVHKSEDLPWFRNGRFDDPLVYGNLNNNQLQKLYLLINNLVNKLPDFEKSINVNRDGKEQLSLSPLLIFLQTWRQQIVAKGVGLIDEGALDSEIKFSQPYMPLFRIKQDIFFKDGIFSFTDNGGQIIDIQKVLLQDDFIYSFTQVDDRQPLSQSAVYYLTALDPKDANKVWYFPIPLSSYGLNMFKNQLSDLISSPAENKHELRATYKPNDFKLIVELFLHIDGKKQTPIVKEYEIKLITGVQRNIIIWPNFISNNWNKYYLYNEYPSNSRDLKFVPFFKSFAEDGGYDAGGFISNNKNEIVYLDSDLQDTDLEVNKVIQYPVKSASADDFAYEVIRSNKPIGGLEIRSLINGKDRVCGYLIVKKANDESMLDKRIVDLSYESNMTDVVVGIDFGSNNSCVSYNKYNDPDVKPVKFTNRRVFLLGAETIDPNQEKTATRNELLYFQKRNSENGQIKSWVHDHNFKYIPEGYAQEEIAGGVPIFEMNLLIQQMDDRTITTNAGTMHYSMKWLTDIQGKQKKMAYLKAIWLKTVADLYAQRLQPKELRWSYPGSFSQFDVGQYQMIYNQLAQTPINGLQVEIKTPSTEAEAVCNYSLNILKATERNLLLGIDVGGSTSNILIVAMDRQARAFKMVKQSSLRMSAGILSEVIKDSKEIRDAIYKFHQSPSCKLKVANIKNMIDKPETAPFYLNAIFDRLRDEDFKPFYSALSLTCPQIFSVPAYITGLLLFYSGQLVAKTIQENTFQGVNMVDLFPFGKGGRIFDWLDTYPGTVLTSEYYNLCFRSGYGIGSEKLKLEKKDGIRQDNKSEVSKGLSAQQLVTLDENVRQNSDIFGEEGFIFYPQGAAQENLDKFQVISTHHLEEMNFGISVPEKLAEFEKFLQIYLDFVGPRKTGIIRNTQLIDSKKSELSRVLTTFISTDPEWQKADEQRRNGQPFEYKHSMIVLEGLCFLKKFIIPEVFK